MAPDDEDTDSEDERSQAPEGPAEWPREVHTTPFARVAERLDEMQRTPFAGVAEQLANIQRTRFAGVAERLAEMQRTPFARVAEQLDEMQRIPFAGVTEQLANIQRTPFARVAEQLDEMQRILFAGVAEQVANIQRTPFAGVAEQLAKLQLTSYAGLAVQLTEISAGSNLFRTPVIEAVIRKVATSSNVDDLINRIDSEALLREAGVRESPDLESVDLIGWFREVLGGLVRYGGPILLLQVLILTWAMAAEMGSETRTKFVELATLLALAIAVAPEFSKMARKLGGDRDDD